MNATSLPLVHLPSGWHQLLEPEISSDSFLALQTFLERERRTHTIYPPKNLVFHALRLTSFVKAKVVIVGQDPYHGPNQAHGLSFSVPEGVPLPPSLRNIYKEVVEDVGGSPPTSGDLTGWAQQGVLLLNSSLTVRKGEAGSHAGRGWEKFTDAIVRLLLARKEPLVFMLWGRFAKDKLMRVDGRGTSHLILQAAHPSPLSAHNGFFGCRHFSKANAFLQQQGREPIRWNEPVEKKSC